MAKKNLMFVFGTRPDTIKLAPLILKASAMKDDFNVTTVATAQHRQMLDDVLQFFNIKPDVDLNIMSPGQSLFHVTARIITEMEPVLAKYKPDVVIVQGDTATTFTASLAGFYSRCKIAHVEAGLRTYNKYHPFPEEINRRLTSIIADYHFVPTLQSKQNLLNEGFPENIIYHTGNTIIDALFYAAEKVKDYACPVSELAGKLTEDKNRLVLITGHRRENFGAPFKRICKALRNLAEKNPDVTFVYPVHLNPNVQSSVSEILSGLPNFYLLKPLCYPDFIWFMKRSYFIISDSGGIQEEAPALGKPVLVTRRITERPEVAEAGVVQVVGDDGEKLFKIANELLKNKTAYEKMAKVVMPYGDGTSSTQILDVLKNDVNVAL